MDWFLSHILDIVIILIVIIGIVAGHSRGIVRMIISLVGFAIAIAAATFVSSITYEYIYDQAVKPAVMTVIEAKADELITEYNPEERMKELLYEQGVPSETTDELFEASDIYEMYSEQSSLLTGEQFRGTLNNVFTEYCTKLTESLSGVLPDEIVDSAKNYLEDSNAKEEEKLQIFKESKTSIAVLIEQEIIRPILQRTVKSIIFALTFILVNIIFMIISRLVGVLRSITAVKALDSFFGGILGLLYSLLIIAVFALMCSIFIQLTGDENAIISNQTISQSYIFKYVYTGTFSIISALFY